MNKPLELIDFLKRDAAQTSDGAPVDVQQMVSTALVAQHVPGTFKKELVSISLAVPATRLDQAQSEAMELVSSKPFLREISKEIGVPLEGETEDNFVARAKEIIQKVLEKLLK